MMYAEFKGTLGQCLEQMEETAIDLIDLSRKAKIVIYIQDEDEKEV